MGEWLPTHIWHPQGATFLMARGTPSMLTTGHSSQPLPPPVGGISSAPSSRSFTCESKMLTTLTEEPLRKTKARSHGNRSEGARTDEQCGRKKTRETEQRSH